MQPGFLMVEGEQVDAAQHAHDALQVIIPFNECHLTVDGAQISTASPCLIYPNIQHQLTIRQGIILLIDSKSRMGQWLSQTLSNERTFLVLELDTRTSPQMPEPSSADEQIHQGYHRLLEWLAPELTSPLPNHCNPYAVDDQRINAVLSAVDDALALAAGMDITHVQAPISVWQGSLSAETMANKVHLSSSRFQHLFSEQIGLPWRAYVLWRRLKLATRLLLFGINATEAAHRSGFSDSAHLSRTFKRHFGMNLRDAKRSVQAQP